MAKRDRGGRKKLTKPQKTLKEKRREKKAKKLERKQG